MIWRGVECPSKAAGFSKRPRRGPRIAAPTSAAQPPVMCTTPEPAKSMTPPRTCATRHARGRTHGAHA